MKYLNTQFETLGMQEPESYIEPSGRLIPENEIDTLVLKTLIEQALKAPLFVSDRGDKPDTYRASWSFGGLDEEGFASVFVDISPSEFDWQTIYSDSYRLNAIAWVQIDNDEIVVWWQIEDTKWSTSKTNYFPHQPVLFNPNPSYC